MGSPSRGWDAGSCDARPRMSGSELVPPCARCRTTSSEPSKSPGSVRARRTNASTPPADAPTAAMLRSTPLLLIVGSLDRVAHRHHSAGSFAPPSAAYDARVADSWEESFDTWSGEDVRKLARELPAELESRGRELAARAEAIAARERELAEREKAVEQEQRGGRLRLPRRSERREAADEPLAARAAELGARSLELEARARELDERERELADADAGARKWSVSLEEREAAVNQREDAAAAAAEEVGRERRELAVLAKQFDLREKELEAGAEDAAARAAALEARAEELRDRGGELEARERELSKLASAGAAA